MQCAITKNVRKSDGVALSWPMEWNDQLMKYMTYLKFNGDTVIACMVDTGSSQMVIRPQDVQQQILRQAREAPCAENATVVIEYSNVTVRTRFVDLWLCPLCKIPAGISDSLEFPHASLWGLAPTVEPDECISSIKCLLDYTSGTLNTALPAMTIDLSNPNQATIAFEKFGPLKQDEMELQFTPAIYVSNVTGVPTLGKYYLELRQPMQGVKFIFIDTATTYTRLPMNMHSFPLPLKGHKAGPALIQSRVQNRQGMSNSDREEEKYHQNSEVGCQYNCIGTLGILDMMGYKWTFIFSRDKYTQQWQPFLLRVSPAKLY